MKKRIISFLVAIAVVITSLNLPIASTAATQEDGNLLYGLTATANAAHYNGWYDVERPISSLTNGNTHVGEGYNLGNTFVAPYEENGSAYVNFSFEIATTLNKVVVYFPGYNAVSVENQVRDYVVDVQLENGAWERVAEKHNEERSHWDAFSDTLCFAPITCKNLRITCVNTHGQSSIGFYEIEAYYDASLTSDDYTPMNSYDYTEKAIPLPEITNSLYQLTVTANPERNSEWWKDTYALPNLTDGERVTDGYNLGKAAQTKYSAEGLTYFNFAFGKATTLNKVVFVVNGKGGNGTPVKDYAIDVKLPNGTWKRVAEKHYDDSYSLPWGTITETVCFEAVTCTELRFTSKAMDGQTVMSLYEMEAYHDNTLTSANHTPINSGDYTADAIPFPETTNLLYQLTVTANPERNGEWWKDTYALPNLTDGERVTDGYNLGKAAQTKYSAEGLTYFNFVFEKETTLNKVVFVVNGQGGNGTPVKDYALDVKLSNGTWKRVAEKHYDDSYSLPWGTITETVCFGAVTCTELRFTSKAMDGQTVMSLYEMEAYHDNTLTSANHTPINSGDFTEKVIPRPKFSDWVEDGKAPALNEYAYSFAVVGDTQIVSKNDATNGTTDLANMYQYIIDKKEAYKISQVIGLGDIVDTYTDGEQKEAEWNVALNAIKKLDDVKLPYTLIPGNHDVNWNFNYRVSNLGYLNQSQIVSKYGKIEAGQTTDEPSASNTAHAFTAGGRNYLILTLEYSAKSTPGVMDWANAVVAAHPYHNVIVTTHAYLAADGSILDGSQAGSPSSYTGCENDNNGDYFWDNLIKKHDNIVMVLCGHVGVDNIVKSTKVGEKGNTVTQIMINPQDLEAEIGSTGMLAFMYFSEDGKTVQLRQYSTVWDRYYGNASQTTFTIPVIEPIEGDVNADREVDVRDLIRYKKYVLKADNSVVISKLTSDLNDDTEFDTDDVVVLRKMLVGIEEYEFDSNANKSVVYLSINGKDTWTGTETQPYGTLEKALAAVEDDGVIQIQGTYELTSDFVWEKHNKTVTISGGVLDGTSLGNTILLRDHVTFDNITLKFTKNSYLFANGYSLTIKENIAMPNRIRVYGGGQIGTTVASTDLKLYGGSYEAIFGGSDGGTVIGNTSVVVGGNVNEGITPKHDATDYFVYGGGVADTVEGNTNVTFGGNAKAHYVFGGSYGESAKVLQGTNVYVIGGTVSGVYGGGNKGGTGKSGTITGGAYVEMTGGTVDQVFGGNAASDMTGDVQVKILGGTVTRRIYGGCYNEYKLSWLSTYSVSGKITLTLSGEANLAFSYDDADLSVFARSRRNPKSDNEHSYLIYVNGGAMYVNKMGANDSSAKLMMSGVSAYDSCETQ